MVSITLVRHATLLVELGDTRLLVDPMLSDAGVNPPIDGSPNDRRNPLCDLPGGTEWDADALIVTHLHHDHLDDPARDRFGDAGLPVFCQPEDEASLSGTFDDVRIVDDDGTTEFEGLTLTRTPARHGHGEWAERMAPVCGFVLEASDERLYLAGDTVWYDEVAATLDAHDPTAVVCNAGAAQFEGSRPITMAAEDVAELCDHTDAPVVAVHMEAINHCLLTRDGLTQALAETDTAGQVTIPDDGETVDL
ncbi:MBL fold metallo-hydrolase [Halomarina oriensis]|uniref:MBL fold metallo-hydrolase n=1 Tax=Halomarina oriensis TaxID=671145 RepID=A0A6B0GNT4_9EURY|nr:MBL fold metallo-hydrolase [Halomarina oriensis]MWG35179.1 MBL fold metallo-hydrolase [Halomarina oriensis]